MTQHTPVEIAPTGEALPPPTEDEGQEQGWCDDTRKPEVVFGRCALTGQWGTVVAVDLGNIVVEVPDAKSATIVDGEVQFGKWETVTYSNQLTVSSEGLTALKEYLDSQDSVIPSITPDLVYAWQVSYEDGDALRQFQHSNETGTEKEINSREIDKARVAQLSIVSHYGDPSLPTYTFVKATGEFYCDGKKLDIDYPDGYDPDADLIYFRKVNHTYASQMVANSMNRSINGVHTSVKQLIGWKQGGLEGKGLGFILAVDERGHCEPWEYRN